MAERAAGASLVVERAAGYLAVQDLGRPGHRADGVAAGGAMDPVALRVANLLAGNGEGAAALEWSVGAAELRLEGARRVAVAGAGARVTLDGAPLTLWTGAPAAPGSVLRIEPAPGGRFAYVAVSGGVAVPAVLGSRATHLAARLGGHEGRVLRADDRLPLGIASAAGPGGASATAIPEALRPADDAAAPLRLIASAQRALLDDDGWRTLLDGELRVGAGDRMGYRLDGARVVPRAEAALPSEGACPGAVQLPGDGHPIVLMPDGPTVGGYAKPAVVAGVDLPRLAQRAAGRAVRFALVEVDEARRLLLERERWMAAVREGVTRGIA